MATVHVTQENFESTLRQGIVMLDFWAGLCGPCRSFAPIFEAASSRHPDIVFGKVDTEEQPELAAAFNVQGIPTLAVIRDGVLLMAQAGALPAAALDEIAEKARALDMDEVRKAIAEEAKADGQAEGHA